MKIKIEKYTPKWRADFEIIKTEILELIDFINPKIEHIGSTSVEGLSAKPIIDILIGVNNESELEQVIHPLIHHGYVYYEKYNEVMPYRRFFVKHKANSESYSQIISCNDTIPADTNEHNNRLAHIHVLMYDSTHWIRHIAFRDYLKTHPLVLKEYQDLKMMLQKKEWQDGNAYNEAKHLFIKMEERKAIDWYQNND